MFLQPLKAYSPTLADFGIEIVFKPIHHQKALSPILITELGILISCKLSQPEKAR